ncbi:sulfatase [Photobacterium sagamiensis]|uniref:sulfatase family protein n=1 Tax=Photobacterium sagamiensis TaxID=2910241 RepID=UPI003D09DBD5
MKISRSTLAQGIGALITASSLTAQAAPVTEQPNILFIFSDDHSTRAISAYGGDLVKTPNIDRIAQEGAIFENAFVGNSICQPSRASIITGKHSHLNGVIDNSSRWNPDQTIYPKLMENAGYQTALIGKWHMNPAPVNEFGYSNVLNGAGGQGTYYQPEFIDNKGKVTTVEGYSTDIITDKSIDWLEQQRDADKPFLLQVQYKSPHTPRRPPLRNLELFKDTKFPVPATLYDDYNTRGQHAKEAWMELYGMTAEGINAFPPAATTPEKKKIREDWLASMNKPDRAAFDKWMNRLTDDQRKAWHAAYDDINVEYWNKIQTPAYKMRYGFVPPEEKKARTEYNYQRFMKEYAAATVTVDENIGRILNWLDENNMAENTIVVYSSDQSFYIGEHGWAEKRYMYEEGMKMPFVIRWPDVIPANSKPQAMIQNIDFGPTFLTAVGLDVPGEMQGKSFMDLLKGKQSDSQWQKERPYVYYHYYMEGAHNVPRHDGVRSDRYKLINFYSENGGKGLFEMYDLKVDPNEVNNVFDDPKYKETRDTMVSELVKTRQEYGVPEDAYEAPYPFMTRDERKALGF